jgi:hypothetical protein
MTARKTETEKSRKEQDRKARLAAQLRANLQRRKAQSRAKRTGGSDSRPEGIGAAGEKPKG